EPGDMLYIPPGVAHWGIAEGESITYSIGFRAPSHEDIVCDLSHEISTTMTNDQRYSDPDVQRQNNPGGIGSYALQQSKSIMLDHLTDETIAQWFGKYMTERKYAQDEACDDEISIADWQAALQDGVALWRHPAARLAYRALPQGAYLFADGQVFNCTLPFAELVCQELEFDYKRLQELLVNNDNLNTLTALINQETLLLGDDE